MVVVACLEAVALLAVVALLLRHQSQQETAWTSERRELLNRVQQPDRLPLTIQDNFAIPEREPDEIGLVGQILEPELDQ